MKVDRVSANIRFSQDTGRGAWKSVELGAEGTVSDEETWEEAQARLYQELTSQLRALWGRGASQKAADGAGNAAESADLDRAV